jgi:hypothetical protein
MALKSVLDAGVGDGSNPQCHPEHAGGTSRSPANGEGEEIGDPDVQRTVELIENLQPG